ncbi:hypothetical protein Pelo_6289 [Pelomyxa schiedti]|nr:hypothetical protein Pelo_6289 [Pelomyxa schiedti]
MGGSLQFPVFCKVTKEQAQTICDKGLPFPNKCNLQESDTSPLLVSEYIDASMAENWEPASGTTELVFVMLNFTTAQCFQVNSDHLVEVYKRPGFLSHHNTRHTCWFPFQEEQCVPAFVFLVSVQ